MGNKSSRHKSTSDVPSKKRKKPGSATSPTDANGKHDKHISCPDLGGAVPYRLYDEEPKVKYNIYRSYRDLDNNKLAKDSSQVDIRIYRRSTAELPSSGRPQTLPRGFGRSKSAYASAERPGTMTPNGGGEMNSYLDWERAHAVRTPDSDYGGTMRSASEYGAGTLRSGRSSRMSKRSSIASSTGTSSSKLTQVIATDFPSTSDVKRKLSYFEEQYAISLVQKYSQLPTSDQLASLAVAMRKRFGQTQTITLSNYMDGENVPSDLLAPQESGKYILCIPEALFRGIEHLRNSGNKKPKIWALLAKDIVKCVGVESGNELSRMYETQITLMFDDASIRVLANHAAECVVDYVRNNTYLDRNSALHGVVSNNPPNPDGLPKYLAVVVGDKEMKWELYEIFKKTGLRKEISLQTDDLIMDPDEESMEPDPWTYHYGSGAEILKYGYRGQLIEWNFMEQIYELDQEEDEKFIEEAMWRPEDFHRLYMPHRRLFGRKAMMTYSKLDKKGNTPDKLADRLKTEFDGNEERDEIQPVYRPLGASGEPINFADVNLENMDLSRVHLSGNLSGTSLQGSKLLLADVPKVEWENLKGADVSYSTLDSSLTPERIQEMIARHIAMRRSLSPRSSRPRSSRSSGYTSGSMSPGPRSSGSMSPGPRSPVKINGVQETNLDHTMGVVIENDAEYPSSQALVSNSQGQMVPIVQIIQEKLREEEELESIKARDEVDQGSAVSSVNSVVNGSAPPVTIVTHEKLRAEKKKKRRQKRRPQSDHVNPILNISAASEQSSTDFNILEDRQVAQRPPMQRSTTFDQGFSHPVPIQKIETRTVSASSIPVNHTHTVSVIHHYNNASPQENQSSGNQSESDELRPSSATPLNTKPHEASRSPSQGRSLSSSHIPHETYTGHDGRYQDQLPPVRGTRVTSTLPQMVKSVSHHGHLKGSHLGFPPLNRRQRSSADIEYIRRSQIFNMMKGLTIINLEDNLPDVGVMFVGREREVRDVTDLLSSAGRIITIFGCSGIGKSSLAISAALEMKPKYVVPVHFDCRGCISTESIWKVMMITLELRFKLSEIIYFYNWVNCREQKPLFVFDNIELPFSEDRKLSEMMDKLMGNVKNLRVLCTCDRNFFRGESTHESYRVGAIRSESQAILGLMVPDLHDEGINELAASVDYVTLGLLINGKSFAIEDVDSGKLYEDLTKSDPGDFPAGKLEDVLAEITSDDIDKQKLGKVAQCVHTVLEYFHPEVRELLTKLSCTCSFSTEMACSLSGMEEEKVRDILSELVNGYLLRAVTKHGGRFYIPRVVKIAVDTCWPDNGSNSRDFVCHFVQLLRDQCTRYHSKDCREALDVVDAEFDNILEAVSRILEREDAFELCADFASPEYAMFLYEILPRGMYEDLYDSLVQQAEEQATWTVQMYALCSLAHMHTAEHELDRAKVCAERAYAIAQKHATANHNDKEKAQCMLSLGKVYWQDKENKDKAEILVKKALDTLKLGFGLRHLRTLYANEEYGYILTEKGSFQTARHFYNLSDFIVKELLDTHPLLLDGYNCRRAIWDHLCLFARATEVAEKAATTALVFLGEHPTTAAVLAHQCDAVMRRGSLTDAVQIAIKSLAIRIKVLGDSEPTAASYKTVAFLLMRSGQYDEALRFGQSSLDIHDKLNSNDRLQIEVKNIMAQCRFRLDCRATRFVELESRDASKKHIKDSTSVSSALSTEV